MFIPLKNNIIAEGNVDFLLNNDENRIKNTFWNSYKSNILILGPTGSGKTSLLVKLLANEENNKFIDQILILAPAASLQSGIYKKLITDGYPFQSLEDGIPPLYNSLDKRLRNVVIIDDFLTESWKENKAGFKEYLCNSSRRNASIYALTQQYKMIEKRDRGQFDIFFMMAKTPYDEMEALIKEKVPGELEKKEILGIHTYLNKPINKYKFFSINTNKEVKEGRFRIENDEYIPIKNIE